jgi:hypothetical protein
MNATVESAIPLDSSPVFGLKTDPPPHECWGSFASASGQAPGPAILRELNDPALAASFMRPAFDVIPPSPLHDY